MHGAELNWGCFGAGFWPTQSKGTSLRKHQVEKIIRKWSIFPSLTAQLWVQTYCRLHKTQVLRGRPCVFGRQVPNRRRFHSAGTIHGAPQLCLSHKATELQTATAAGQLEGKRVIGLLWDSPEVQLAVGMILPPRGSCTQEESSLHGHRHYKGLASSCTSQYGLEPPPSHPAVGSCPSKAQLTSVQVDLGQVWWGQVCDGPRLWHSSCGWFFLGMVEPPHALETATRSTNKGWYRIKKHCLDNMGRKSRNLGKPCQNPDGCYGSCICTSLMSRTKINYLSGFI